MVTAWLIWLCLCVQEVGPIVAPVFDNLLYVDTEGQGLGDFIACDDIRYIDRGQIHERQC